MKTLPEYSKETGIPLREVYRMVERGELEVIEEERFTLKRKVKVVKGT